ncbi:hypothetical protein GCM10010306_094870 [Streptomyces umbrinus]|nr:hypothetical protein GCM10010306_094870 [Streptomyces umbrinus]GHH59040.1 hypothetical protein GCM10018775_69900 [Streptomyces umbrinus]
MAYGPTPTTMAREGAGGFGGWAEWGTGVSSPPPPLPVPSRSWGLRPQTPDGQGRKVGMRVRVSRGWGAQFPAPLKDCAVPRAPEVFQPLRRLRSGGSGAEPLKGTGMGRGGGGEKPGPATPGGGISGEP